MSNSLVEYNKITKHLLGLFADVLFKCVPRRENNEANELAQIPSRLKIPLSIRTRMITIKRRLESSLISKFDRSELVLSLDVAQDDWRFPIIKYLQNPSIQTEYKVRKRALKFVILDDELYKKTWMASYVCAFLNFSQCKSWPKSIKEFAGHTRLVLK